LILLVSACGQRDVLTENTWILIGGTFHGKQIDFHTTDDIVLTSVGNEPLLQFGKDENIILPGINSANISARWTITDGKIHFSIDSTRYSYLHRTVDLRILEDSTHHAEPVDMFSEFRMPMKIYGQALEYHISLDTLTLSSKDVKLWAVRDRQTDELFKHLR
jgi:hypothetical protein